MQRGSLLPHPAEISTGWEEHSNVVLLVNQEEDSSARPISKFWTAHCPGSNSRNNKVKNLLKDEAILFLYWAVLTDRGLSHRAAPWCRDARGRERKRHWLKLSERFCFRMRSDEISYASRKHFEDSVIRSFNSDAFQTRMMLLGSSHHHNQFPTKTTIASRNLWGSQLGGNVWEERKWTLRLYHLFPSSQNLIRNTKIHGRAPVWEVSTTTSHIFPFYCWLH